MEKYFLKNKVMSYERQKARKKLEETTLKSRLDTHRLRSSVEKAMVEFAKELSEEAFNEARKERFYPNFNAWWKRHIELKK